MCTCGGGGGGGGDVGRGEGARGQGGGMAAQKTVLYVGGLEETVNEATLHAAFIPFGEIKDVTIPLEHAAATDDGAAKHRGFGFVEFIER